MSNACIEGGRRVQSTCPFRTPCTLRCLRFDLDKMIGLLAETIHPTLDRLTL